MPRKKTQAPPPHTHPELVDVLVEELKKTGVSSTPATPTIYEEAQTYGDSVHVTVIWDQWKGIPPEERGAIVLDAYKKAGEEDKCRRITLVLGLTPDESQKLGISP
jgi:hypothetical protein